jgi:hypothetical protein
MKTNRLLSGITGLALFAAISSAQATTVDITFSVDSLTSSTASELDTMTLAASSQTISFVTGVSQRVTLNLFDWSTHQSPDSLVGGNLTLNRYLTVGNQSILLNQGATILGAMPGLPARLDVVGPTVNNNPIEFIVGNGLYRLDFTAFSQSQYFFQTGDATHPTSGQIYATATLSAVPETSTTMAGAGALGLLLLGVGVHSKRTVQRIG